MVRSKRLLLLAIVVGLAVALVPKLGYCGEVWRVTAYCSCVKCCGKSDGVTASGHKLKPGDKVVACNWLPFGTSVEIKGLGVYSVQDRGARSLFGSKKNRIKHLDVWFASHKEALRFGNQFREVMIK